MSKKVAVIGAGPGGLTSGMLLANKGYQVDIYEKNSYLGGRNGRITLGEYHFDIGPTFLMLIEVLEDMFKFCNRKIDDYLELKEIDPFYRLRFNGEKDFFPSRNREYMLEQINELFPGDAPGYEKFMRKEKIKFDKVYKCLKMPYDRIFHFLRPQLIKAMPSLNLGRTLHGKLGDYFKNEDLKIAMTFQSKYLGMSPWNCPATFTILSYIEHSRGIFHPIGGLNRISEAMAKIINEDGGNIHLSTGVKEIIVEDGKAKGLILENNEKVMADHIIINADFAHAMTSIIDKKNRKKYTNEDLSRRDYSCSTFMLYLGVKKKYDIKHHNIIFSSDYKKNVYEISDSKELSSDPSFYIQNASITDPTLAPEGKSAIYILVPVPNNFSKINWEEEKDSFRDLVLNKIKEKTEIKDLADNIEEELIITPFDWEKNYGVYNGATFNLSHKISQMLYFRPHNKFQEFDNCYLTGGGTHPGSGLPTIYESARISANIILSGGSTGLGIRYKDLFED